MKTCKGAQVMVGRRNMVRRNKLYQPKEQGSAELGMLAEEIRLGEQIMLAEGTMFGRTVITAEGTRLGNS